MIRAFAIAIVAAQLAISIPAYAEIYKCIDDDGNVSFTTKPGPGCELLPGSVEKKTDDKPTPTPAPKKRNRTDPQGCFTKAGYVACLKKEWLDDMTSFISQKDQASFKAYIVCKKCLILKGGLKVTVTDWPGIFGGTTGFIYQGIKFWTYREAIDYNP